MNSCGLMDGLGSKKSRFPNWLKDSMNCWSLKDLRGMMLYMAQNQQWSRYLQCKMDGCTDEEKNWIFMELIEHVGKLMLHPFGNYVAQKLVEICSEHQRTQILQKVIETNSLVHMCLNNLGSRSIQKLLKHFTTQQQISLFMYALSPGTLALCKDLNGQHVIQHCLMHFSDEDNMHLLNEVANNCLKIATDRSGCCVLQKCLKHCKGALKERLVAGIIANALLLAEDQYGNYVVQYLLELRIQQVTKDLLRQFKGSYFIFSSNKFGSNVVEKCLVETVEEHSASIIIELLTDPKCSMLLIDPYGNFVIQKALLVSKGYIRNALLELVQSNSPMMTSNLYGRKVLTFCQKELNINFRTRC
ncbi:putative pumilio like protein 8 [Quercus suber]|uniref:Pumilio like protein 8 n=2 Tax=Quercus suber TaxID=58331 RepID=A0AAW0LMK2_QUESU